MILDVSAPTDGTTRHDADTCADYLATPQPLSLMVAELIALHAHTRHLRHLATRQQNPDAYRQLACSVLRNVLAGWRYQTDGGGTVHDLLVDETGH